MRQGFERFSTFIAVSGMDKIKKNRRSKIEDESEKKLTNYFFGPVYHSLCNVNRL